MGETAHQQARAPIPAVASLRVDPERLQQLWAMRPAERVAAAREGRFTLGEMLQWANRRPREVPLIDGDFFFISAFLADCGEYTPLPDTRDTSRPRPAAAGDTSRERRR